MSNQWKSTVQRCVCCIFITAERREPLIWLPENAPACGELFISTQFILLLSELNEAFYDILTVFIL